MILHNYSGRDPGSNPRLKVEELLGDSDTSSLSQSSENDEDSYMEVEHQGVMVSSYNYYDVFHHGGECSLAYDMRRNSMIISFSSATRINSSSYNLSPLLATACRILSSDPLLSTVQVLRFKHDTPQAELLQQTAVHSEKDTSVILLILISRFSNIFQLTSQQ